MSKRVQVIDLFGSLPESPAAAVRGATSPRAKKGEAVAGVMRPLEREKGPSLQRNVSDEVKRVTKRVRYELSMERRDRDPPSGRNDAADRLLKYVKTVQSRLYRVLQSPTPRPSPPPHAPPSTTHMRSSTPPYPEPASTDMNSIARRRRPVRACRLKTKPIIDRQRRATPDEDVGSVSEKEEEDTSPQVQDPLPDVAGPPPTTEVWRFSIPPHKNLGATFSPFGTATATQVPPILQPAVDSLSKAASREKGKGKTWSGGGGAA